MGLGAYAQQIPLYSNYFFTPFIYNPAYSGSKGVTEATIVHRRQWSGLQGSPETSAIALQGALKNYNFGYSLYGYVDQTDILQRTGAYGNYAYHLQLSDDATLSFGIGAGFLNQGINASAVRAQDPNDVFTVVPTERGVFDLSAGLRFKVADFTLGAAAPQLLAQDVVFSDNSDNRINFGLTRHYVANAQYDFAFNGDDQVLSPMVMVRAGENIPVQVDAGLMFRLKKFGYIGAMYRSDYAVTGNIGVNLTDELTLGYAYDFSLNTYGTSLGTSHEFMLTYRFGSNRDNERMENELKRIKMRQLRQQDEVEETVDEKLEEFEEKMKRQQAQNQQESAEDQGQSQAGNNNRRQNNNQQGANRNNRRQNNNRGGRNNANNRQNNNQGDFNPQGLGNDNQRGQNNNRGGNDQSSGVNGGYAADNQAGNVAPGSQGYYITAGVFSSEGNARKRIKQLENKGFKANFFRDSSNGYYYVYLLKFDSYQEADQAKSSKMNGAYDGKLWIKIVK